MNIPIGKRHLVIGLERGATVIRQETALIDATDREIEYIARHQNDFPEPRWEVAAMLGGWHL